MKSTEKGWIKKHKIYSDIPVGTRGYLFQHAGMAISMIREIRYAFCYLYDREKMNREMYYNEYGMMNSLYSGSVYENKNNNPFKYNPDEAIRLLKRQDTAKEIQMVGWYMTLLERCCLLKLLSKKQVHIWSLLFNKC